MYKASGCLASEPIYSGLHWLDLAWPVYQRIWWSGISAKDALRQCFRTGANRFLDTNFIALAAGKRHLHSVWWLMRCVTVIDTSPLQPVWVSTQSTLAEVSVADTRVSGTQKQQWPICCLSRGLPGRLLHFRKLPQYNAIAGLRDWIEMVIRSFRRPEVLCRQRFRHLMSERQAHGKRDAERCEGQYTRFNRNQSGWKPGAARRGRQDSWILRSHDGSYARSRQANSCQGKHPLDIDLPGTLAPQLSASGNRGI